MPHLDQEPSAFEVCSIDPDNQRITTVRLIVVNMEYEWSLLQI